MKTTMKGWGNLPRPSLGDNLKTTFGHQYLMHSLFPGFKEHLKGFSHDPSYFYSVSFYGFTRNNPFSLIQDFRGNIGCFDVFSCIVQEDVLAFLRQFMKPTLAAFCFTVIITFLPVCHNSQDTSLQPLILSVNKRGLFGDFDGYMVHIYSVNQNFIFSGIH